MYRLMYEIPPTAGLPPRLSDLWPSSKKFDKELSVEFDWPSPLLTCSGTAAFIVILEALKQKSFDKTYVVVPAYTCPLVALAIHRCGLNIILCDIEADSVFLSREHLTQITNNPKYHQRILAVVATHLGGRVENVYDLQECVKGKNIYLIEDAAQALGAKINHQSIGLQGDVGFFSFAIGKGINLYEGGAIVCSNPDLQGALQETHKKLVHRNYFMEIKRSIEFFISTLLYNPPGLFLAYGISYRRALQHQDWIGAVGDDFGTQIPVHRLGIWRQACGVNALQRFSSHIKLTREQAQQRLQLLSSIQRITIIRDINENCQGTWPFFMVLMPSQSARDSVLKALASKGVGVSRLFIHPLSAYDYLSPFIKGTSDFPCDENLPNAVELAQRMLTISNSHWLGDEIFSFIHRELERCSQPN